MESMKNTLIVYGSQYGTTKRYAEHLAETTGIKVLAYTEVKDVAGYDRIIYLGALYAGGVMGLKKTAAKMTPDQELILATVGIADPVNDENISNIRHSIKNQIPAFLYDESRLFHLRGAIDYSHLGMKHRLMMSLLHSKVAKMPVEEHTPEIKDMLATYGKQVDFVDFDSLERIKALIND